MGYKINSALLAIMCLTSSAHAWNYMQVNLFWDSNCHDYATEFTVGDTVRGYNFGYSGAHSFGIAVCGTNVDGGKCEAFVKGVGPHSTVDGSNQGKVGNCVSYDGSQNTVWDLFINDFEEGNTE
ncbi:hypothetical protein V8C42DRAFT_327908 [Trichoderma barbatum]